MLLDNTIAGWKETSDADAIHGHLNHWMFEQISSGW
jgi:hypothetical protein